MILYPHTWALSSHVILCEYSLPTVDWTKDGLFVTSLEKVIDSSRNPGLFLINGRKNKV